MTLPLIERLYAWAPAENFAEGQESETIEGPKVTSEVRHNRGHRSVFLSYPKYSGLPLFFFSQSLLKLDPMASFAVDFLGKLGRHVG